ncbi:MAG: metallophosphoesterase family protein [Muribaculaceae bacterium]|nr:metallophosphoesterase family protein [Muribaculaceae bacterium]
MTEKIIVLSDIHANLSALEAVIADFESKGQIPDALAILGDNINYGMRPNEVILRLQQLSDRYPTVVNLFGNHEKALLDNDTSHFSTERGRQVLDYTRSILSDNSYCHIQNLNHSGICEIEINSQKILFLHGNIDDPYWGTINKDTVSDLRYSDYDYVISGHSHKPHLIEFYFNADCPRLRNKRKTVFLNPGSVGQPRNQNPRAQYLFLDLGENLISFNSASYNIRTEQDLYPDTIDAFYKERLLLGI